EYTRDPVRSSDRRSEIGQHGIQPLDQRLRARDGLAAEPDLLGQVIAFAADRIDPLLLRVRRRIRHGARLSSSRAWRKSPCAARHISERPSELDRRSLRAAVETLTGTRAAIEKRDARNSIRLDRVFVMTRGPRVIALVAA